MPSYSCTIFGSTEDAVQLFHSLQVLPERQFSSGLARAQTCSASENFVVYSNDAVNVNFDIGGGFYDPLLVTPEQPPYIIPRTNFSHKTEWNTKHFWLNRSNIPNHKFKSQLLSFLKKIINSLCSTSQICNCLLFSHTNTGYIQRQWSGIVNPSRASNIISSVGVPSSPCLDLTHLSVFINLTT